MSGERCGIGANPRFSRKHEVIAVSPAFINLPMSLPLYLKHEAPGTKTASLILDVFMKKGTAYDIILYCHEGAFDVSEHTTGL